MGQLSLIPGHVPGTVCCRYTTKPGADNDRAVHDPAVALVLLQLRFADSKTTWDLISKEGCGWLRRQIKSQQQPLMDKVRSILSFQDSS